MLIRRRRIAIVALPLILLLIYFSAYKFELYPESENETSGNYTKPESLISTIKILNSDKQFASCFEEDLKDEKLSECIKIANQAMLDSLRQRYSASFYSNNTLPRLYKSKQPFIPIVVIVHKRDLYLKNLLDIMNSIEGIEETLVIFSLDGYFPVILDVIKKHSGKLRCISIYHTNPMKYQSILKINDDIKAGGARHHYWFVWNFIYQVLFPVIYKGFDYKPFHLTMLEEDHLVTKDFYHTLYALTSIKDRYCKDKCFSINPGLIPDNNAAHFEPSASDYIMRYKGLHNCGLTFSYEMFFKLVDEQDQWCGFNEYNWDWSITMAGQRGIIPPNAVSVDTYRILHTGSCGMHHNSGDCDKAFQEAVDNWIYPFNKAITSSDWKKHSEDKVFGSLTMPFGNHQGWGGWVYDENKGGLYHTELCKKTTKITEFYH